MNKLWTLIVDASLWCCVASDVRSADLVTTARKRAGRGAFLSLVASTVLTALALGAAPDQDTAAGSVGIMQTFVLWLIFAALAVSVIGLYFVVRYVLVMKWPDRFVNLSE